MSYGEGETYHYFRCNNNWFNPAMSGKTLRSEERGARSGKKLLPALCSLLTCSMSRKAFRHHNRFDFGALAPQIPC